ncbi:biosynthetic-type acetolactate synthase large subunit [Anaerosinus sp.]|uniref:biosynthetic-type acetolactate synthase large subunit n=1 Tax=Selenobaculum sp. TaxID=3074374 RepID=UPI0015A7E4F9
MRMNGAEAVITSLKNENIEVVFGYPGGAVLTLYDALYKMQFPHVLTKHEQGAVHAADGYARATGKVGVCFATSGPGGTNLITGIATAYMDSIPLVCITGQVNVSLIGKDSFQEADICGITTPITKHNYLIKKVEDLPRVLKEAFYIARTGRPGPVVIDIAKDVFAKELDYIYPVSVQLKGYTGNFIGTENEIDEVVEVLKTAERPVVFLGGGVTLSDTSPLLNEFIEKTQIPVVSSLMGLGCVPDSYDGNLGMLGMHGTYAANMATMESDVLIGIGVRFDDRVTGVVKEFAPEAKIIHFDIDAAEINKNVLVDYRVVGDLRWSMLLFKEKVMVLENDWQAQFSLWRDKVLTWKKEQPLDYDRTAKCIMPQQVIETVSQIANEDTIIVTDVGQHQMWAAQFYEFLKPRTFLTSGGLGTMGYGLPAAIGAKIGKPKKKVVLITGDGSIMMNCQEFATAADYGIDVKVVVMDNHVLGMVTQWQRMFYGERYSQSKLNGKTDFVKLAEAMGVAGYRVTEAKELKTTLQRAFDVEGPALIDVLLPEAEDVLPMVPAGGRLDQMVLGAQIK